MRTIEQRIAETDLSKLTEPKLSKIDWEALNKGIELFNRGKFWESHEAWEDIWKRHTENSRIFFQGLIQAAAGLHQLERNIYHGVDKHFRNALWKLKPFRPSFLGIDVRHLVELLEVSHAELVRLGKNRLHNYDRNLIPKITRISSEKN